MKATRSALPDEAPGRSDEGAAPPGCSAHAEDGGMFSLNLGPPLSMLQCSKWLDLEASGLSDPGRAATFLQDQDLFS